jgi:hypothetical protein
MTTKPENHAGTLMSGEITCSCGWTSGHYALADDAIEAWDEHEAAYASRPRVVWDSEEARRLKGVLDALRLTGLSAQQAVEMVEGQRADLGESR